MKQHITYEQLDELSEKGQVKLMKWLANKSFGYFPPAPRILFIGEMIEFIIEYQEIQIDGAFDKDKMYFTVESPSNGDLFGKGTELTDSLWEVVKQILEYDETKQKNG